MASYFKREFKRKDGTTYTRWVGEEKINGKTKSVYGKTEKECRAKIKALVVEHEIYGNELKKNTHTLSEWTYKQLYEEVKPHIQASTFERYMSIYNTHIKNSTIGKTSITDINEIDIQNFFNSKNEMATGVLKIMRYTIRRVFEYAKKHDVIRDNPCIGIKIPPSKAKTREIIIMTLDEQEKFITAASTRSNKVLFLTALFTGLRMGELIALKWKNVDLKKATINVCESYKRVRSYDDNGDSEYIIDQKAPKTKNGNRIVPIPTKLLPILKEIQTDNELVFYNSKGQPMTEITIRREQRRICEQAQIRYINFHALRHTYATRLIENGIDVKTVSMLVGHADIQTTLNIYVHSTDDTKKNAVNTLDKFF